VLSDSVTAAAIAAARAAGKPVIVDPKSARLAKYSGATVLTPNRAELQLAAGQECSNDEQIERAARRALSDEICDAMVVTRGRDGMTVAASGAPTVHLHTVAREVFDVSGAGDTALATLALGVAAGGSIVDGARLANVAAGIVVGKRGTAVATAGEILASLDDLSAADSTQKIFTLPSVLRQVERWRAHGMRVAFTNGCFDLLHPGHLSLLQKAKQTADKLVVGLNSDLSVRRLKGAGRPVQAEVARATLLCSLRDVDAVVIFPEDTPLSLIEALEPDVLVKGADYTVDQVVGAQSVMARGGRVVLVELVAGQSTTNIVERMAPGQRS
jgi:D-beta-D-heptose 7-phosphate kinase/D-beta-D-heptose 1-phosphate adenosyltransferase